MPDSYWLFKTEPEVFSWDMLKARGKAGRAVGRRAQLPGPQQHARDEDRRPRLLLSLGRGSRRSSASWRCRRSPIPIPKDDTGEWKCVDVRAVAALPKPVTLAAAKDEPEACQAWCWRRIRGFPCSRSRPRSGARSAAWAASSPRSSRDERGTAARARSEIAPIRRSLHTCQHQAACPAAGAGDHAAARRGVAADLAEDRGGARRDERAAALLGVCVGRRPGAGAADPRPARARGRKARARSRLGMRALRHRRDARRRALRAGGRHRCHRARCDRPQCGGE